VSEAGGEAAGGGGGADTELKTKTPHVNVGNNEHVYITGVRMTENVQLQLFIRTICICNSMPCWGKKTAPFYGPKCVKSPTSTMVALEGL